MSDCPSDALTDLLAMPEAGVDIAALTAELSSAFANGGSSPDDNARLLQAARTEADQLTERSGLPLAIVHDDRVHSLDAATELVWLPADALATLTGTRLTATARPIETATGLVVAAVSLPCGAAAVSLSHAAAGEPVPADAVVAAAAQGWADDTLEAWWRRLPTHAPGTPARLLTLARQVVVAGEDKAKLEWELDALAEQIDSTYEEITLLHFLAQNLQRTDGTTDLAQLCLDRLRDSLHATCGAAWLQVADDESHFLTEGELPLDEFGLARLVAAHESHPWPQPLVRNHLRHRSPGSDRPAGPDNPDNSENPDGSDAAAPLPPELDNFVLVPVHAGTVPVGWLLCANGADGREFGTVEASLLASIAVTLGTHVQNAQAVHQREEMLLGFVRSLVSSLDAKDPYTRGHSERVAAIARALAVRLGCTDEEVEAIHLSGLLHDVGKIGIDDAVLCKPGHLTDAEFEQIKRHPAIGYQILGGIRSLAHILPGVRNHHESWDGSGYPDGLAGTEIPRQARILAVADSYDAMTSDRPYRNGMPLERLQSIFADGRGTQWDPEVIDAYFEIAPDVVELCNEWATQQG